MTSVREIHLIGKVIETLDELHSWCGETHIQKTAYVAKVVRHVPYDSKFILYKHGPYSFDMNAVLNHMRIQNILSVTPQGSYGSSYRLNPGIWSALTRASGSRFDGHDSDIRFVCTQFARKKVVDLERIATAIYVRLHFATLDSNRWIDKLRELKPHINPSDAKLAFLEADNLFQ